MSPLVWRFVRAHSLGWVVGFGFASAALHLFGGNCHEVPMWAYVVSLLAGGVMLFEIGRGQA